jgi:DNA-directed RNA polymerase subunit beta'
MTIGQTGSRKSIPLTGPEAIYHALERLDLGKLDADARAVIRAKKVSKRPQAVQILNALEGLKRNDLKPTDLMISQVPVIPAQFRPYMVMGNSFTPGDANELYRDLFKIRDAFAEAHTELGEEGTGEARLQLYDAVKALYGYREPTEPKTAARGVSGFLQKISGKSPKTSFVQRVMLSKTQDNVGRATATPDPDMGMDDVGIPHDMAWRTFSPYIQSRLVRQGLSPAQAVIAMRDRTPLAKTALDLELKARPVIYSRAPAWHRFNTNAGWARLVDGDSIVTNPYITTGQNLDYDGDALNVHVPSMDASVEEAKNILMPSKALFTDRDYDKVSSPLKHEQILGAFAAQHRPAKNAHMFATTTDAIDAIRRGRVSLSDDVNIPGVTDLSPVL